MDCVTLIWEIFGSEESAIRWDEYDLPNICDGGQRDGVDWGVVSYFCIGDFMLLVVSFIINARWCVCGCSHRLLPDIGCWQCDQMWEGRAKLLICSGIRGMRVARVLTWTEHPPSTSVQRSYFSCFAIPFIYLNYSYQLHHRSWKWRNSNVLEEHAKENWTQPGSNNPVILPLLCSVLV